MFVDRCTDKQTKNINVTKLFENGDIKSNIKYMPVLITKQLTKM